ncbi:unnamed protein product [Leptosia nina]|uniref:MENTAL domain-containing protein n=1 Tax=Leptosia nina TaxID=320188 RepID=A0AAV1JHL0_9NEOP
MTPPKHHAEICGVRRTIWHNSGNMQLLPCLRKYDEKQSNSKQIDREIKQWIKTYNEAIKLLLLGTGESGKTTIIKQMKILHIQGFSASDRTEKIKHIRHNIHESIYEIVKSMTQLNISPRDSKNVKCQQFLLQIGPTGPGEYTEEYFDHVRSLWRDPGVRECFKRSSEYQLIDSAEYFLDRIDLIAKSDYLPSDADILRCRQKTTGIQKIEFKVKVPKSMHGGSQEFWMFDVGGQRGERKKWIQVFEGIHAIWFLVACSDFDQKLREDNTQNRLQESLVLFQDVWQSRFLLEAGLIVFLNKQDLLESKISRGASIAPYFPQYKKFDATGDEYTKTKLFIKSLFVDLTKKRERRNNFTASAERFVVSEASRSRECYFHFTTATDTDNVRTVFRDVHQMILTHILNNIDLNGFGQNPPYSNKSHGLTVNANKLLLKGERLRLTMESPKIVYKYYSNPAFCAQSEVVFAQKSCMTRIVSPDRKRMPPLGANSPRKTESNRIMRTDISDNPLRMTPAGRYKDEPPELPPKPPKYQRQFQRQASLMCKPSRTVVRCRTRSEDLEMAQFRQQQQIKYDRNAESDDGLEDSRFKHRYEVIKDLDDIDYSPTKKRIIEADESEIEEYNVDAPDEHELKEIPTEIVKTVNGKTHRYAIVPSDDEDRKPSVTFTSPMMTKKNLIATQKLHELLSTPRKLKSYASQPSVRMTPTSVSPRQQTPMKITSSTPTHVTPSKSCANLSLVRNATSPISPKAQQKLNYGLPEFERPDVFVTSCREKERSFDEKREMSRDRKVRDKTTAVIMPRVAHAASPSVYSEDTYKSISSIKTMSSAAASLTIAALMLTLCGGLTTGLSFYMMYSVGRRYYLDFGVLSGFTCFLLGLLGLRSRRNQLLPNRNYISGYIVLSTFSLLSAFGLLLLLSIQPKSGTALNDITSGAVCSISVLSLGLATVGILASYCCARDPPDNRMADYHIREAAESLLGSVSQPPYRSFTQSQSVNLLTEDLVAGHRPQGRMSSIRRFFCLFVTFDLLFTSLMWLICVVMRGETLVQIFTREIVHYDIKVSLFDIVLVAVVRFLLLILFYAILYINNWSIIALTTSGTCAFLIAKVFVFDWPNAPQPVYQVFLILTSFTLSWGEAWFLDFRVLPQELQAKQILETIVSHGASERTPLLASRLGGTSTRGDSTVNWFSPVETPESSPRPQRPGEQVILTQDQLELSDLKVTTERSIDMSYDTNLVFRVPYAEG